MRYIISGDIVQYSQITYSLEHKMQKVRFTLEWFRICRMHIVHGWGVVRISLPHESSRLLRMQLLLEYMVSFYLFCICNNK